MKFYYKGKFQIVVTYLNLIKVIKLFYQEIDNSSINISKNLVLMTNNNSHLKNYNIFTLK